MTVQDCLDNIFKKHDAECLRLTEQLKKTIIERDEARREVCELFSKDCGELDLYGADREAKRRGWDCFKNQETP